VTLLGILTYIFRPPCGPVVDTASNINERQGYHVGMNAIVCRADKFVAFLCRLSRNSGSFNLLEHKVFIQASTGIANVITHPQTF